MAAVRPWDAVVVGAGAAGIFAALTLGRAGARTLVLEMGEGLAKRRCPRLEALGGCRRCVHCALLAGWGGAGAYSDGKLSLSPQVGGWLAEFVPRPALLELLAEVDGVYRSHGAPDRVHGRGGAEFTALAGRAR
ncbi:MAG: NAD(P)-binding protein, partial [Deferrisomatales bacterium]